MPRRMSSVLVGGMLIALACIDALPLPIGDATIWRPIQDGSTPPSWQPADPGVKDATQIKPPGTYKYVGVTSKEPTPAFLPSVHNFFRGIGYGVENTMYGAGNVLANPIRTLRSVGHFVADPVTIGKEWWKQKQAGVKSEGDAFNAGLTAFSVASFVVPVANQVTELATVNQLRMLDEVGRVVDAKRKWVPTGSAASTPPPPKLGVGADVWVPWRNTAIA
jgi:hypothetical protein